LFRAQVRPFFHGFTPDLNWGTVVSGGIEVVKIPGNHGSILQQPNVDALAIQVQAILNKS